MRWEKPLEPLPCALAETVARASDSAASSLAPAARIGARGEVGRRLKREAPRHAKNHLIMRSLERPKQCDTFPAAPLEPNF